MMTLPIVIIGTIIAALLGGGIYWLVQGRKDWNKEYFVSTLVFRTLFFASILGGLTFAVLQGYGSAANFDFLRYWKRADEFGYIVIITQMVVKGVPFFIMGAFMTFAYKQLNKVRLAAVFGLVLAIVYGIVRAALGSFDIDELIYAFIFFVAGFSFTTLIAWILPNKEIFRTMNFSKKTNIFGVFYLVFIYFLFMLALILNNSAGAGTLRLPDMSQPLPEKIVNEAKLTDDAGKIKTYKAENFDMVDSANKVGEILGMSGQAFKEGIQDSNKTTPQNAIIQDGQKTLQYNVSGAWTYTNDAAAAKTGAAPDDDTAIQIASDAVLSGVAPGYEIQNATVESVSKDENGVITQKEVYITPKYGQLSLVIGGDFFVTIGQDGDIVSIRKYDPNFVPDKDVQIISAKKAYEYIGNYQTNTLPDKVSVSHTLYQPATELTIKSVELGYWLEESTGVLLPIWIFHGDALMSDGQTQNASVYVSAKTP